MEDEKRRVALIVQRLFDPLMQAPLSVWEHFAAALSAEAFPKNYLLKGPGETERKLYLLQEGSVGLFLQREQHDVCIDLCFEQEFAGDYRSLLLQKPSPIYVMTLEPCKLLSIGYEDLMRLYDTEIGAKVARSAAESLFIHKQAQQIELLTMTAEARYALLMKETPHILLRCPQIHLASYLGITPESLSRIRKKLMHKDA